jgi:tetratricopeptide (TPR) repeat protein
MNIDDAVSFARSLIENQTQKPLNDAQMIVLRGSLQGDSYSVIVKSHKFSEEYCKQVGAELWKILSSALGIQVTKKNVITVIEEQLKQQQQNIPISDMEINNNQPLDFVGRNEDITNINTLVRQGKKIIVIHAAGGVGKTTLAKQYLYNQGFDFVLPLEMAKEQENITNVESVVEQWLKQYFKEEPEKEFGITLTRLKQQLQNHIVGILIDNLEPALDGKGRFIKNHGNYAALLRALADSTVKSVTLITTRERLCDDNVNSICHYLLDVLTMEAWEEFFASHEIKIDIPSLAEMHKIYGGNAKAIDILLGVIQTDYQGDMAVYWKNNFTKIETELKNLVESQFEQLKSLPEAYKLLCRLGCYRYQDVPQLSQDALLALLWDIPEHQKHINVIQSLRNRRLFEFLNGYYWLHPMIREESIKRLKLSGEWEEVNRKAAKFWQSSVKTIETVEDAKKAFEAYHHYVSINDFEQAGYIIVEPRDSSWGIDEYLGRSFYRLGLLTPIIPAINLVEEYINSEKLLANLYNIAGDLYYLLGNINEAINYLNKSLEFVNNLGVRLENNKADINLHDDIELLEDKAKFNLCLCNIDILDMQEALDNLESFQISLEYRIKIKGETIYLRAWRVIIWAYLAFLYSWVNSEEKLALAESLAERVSNSLDNNIKLTSWGNGYALIILGLTYKNLEEIEKSNQMYDRAIKFAKKSKYIQIEARALTGLAELYRIQDNFEKALSKHSESIEKLDKIGTRCDLAEAYFQLGLTYQKMGEFENSQVNFDKAIKLFTEMEAPKQVEKVEKRKIKNLLLNTSQAIA